MTDSKDDQYGLRAKARKLSDELVASLPDECFLGTMDIAGFHWNRFGVVEALVSDMVQAELACAFLLRWSKVLRDTSTRVTHAAPSPPPLSLDQVWAKLVRILPALGSSNGVLDVSQEIVLRELRSHGVIPSDPKSVMLGGCQWNSKVDATGRVVSSCSLKVGPGPLDWVEASAPTWQEALCRAALKAIEDLEDRGFIV